MLAVIGYRSLKVVVYLSELAGHGVVRLHSIPRPLVQHLLLPIFA